MSGSGNALAVILLGSSMLFAQPYQATTESLRTHKAPQWYEDAKFGVFLHWGPYAVPAYHEWYVEFISPKSNYGFMFGGPPFTATPGDLPPQLFLSKTRADAIEYHKKNWGADFPYDNFLPMFKAEKFDPDAWAKLFRDAGAQYVVMTAKHAAILSMLERNPGKTLSELKKALPVAYTSLTMSPHCADEVKYDVVGQVTEEYRGMRDAGGRILGRRIVDLITVNGVRVALEDGSWVLVRASSNKPEIVVVVESTRSEDDMRALFRQEVKPRLAAHPEVGAYNQEI